MSTTARTRTLRNIVAKDPEGKIIYSGPAKQVPPGMLDRVIHFGEHGKIEVKGGKVSSYELNDEDQDDEKQTLAPSATPAASPKP